MRQKALSVIQEVKQAVIGKDMVIAKVLMVILARGHILLEDNPGVGKTTMALAFSKAMDLDYKRIQFTPEVLPADVVGFSVFNKAAGRLEYQPGAALCNLLLADEINRTSSKTQSALLEAMEEGRITVDGVTRELPRPYTVLATQNPVGSAGTQLLPQSQMDRFMVRLSMGYPKLEDEVKILKLRQGYDLLTGVRRVVDGSEILQMQRQVDEVYVADEVYTYIARLVAATREHPMVRLGASPRGSIALAQLGRAVAWLNGRDYLLPEDVQTIYHDVLEHRLVLAPQAKISGKSARELLSELLRTVPAPKLVQS